MNLGEIVTFRPWERLKRCPKCDHPNIDGGRYVEASELLPEHLLIKCVACSYLFRMVPKS